jgi:hypothetical protein
MSRPPRQDRRLRKVLAALRAHGGPARSPLYRWMRQHHDALAAAFAETPPAWGPLAAELAAVGLTDADGKPPAATNARQTWYRVRRDLARVRAQPAAAASVLAPDEIAPAVHAVMPPTAAAHDPAALSRPRMAPDIRPARAATGEPPLAAPATTGASAPGLAPATGLPAPNAGVPDPAPATQATETAAAQIRRLFSTIDAGKVPLPKIM